MDNPTTIYIFAAIGGIGVLLQVVVLFFIGRSALPRYWGVFCYLLVLFLTSVCDMAAYLNPDGYPDWYLKYWVVNNSLRHLSGFVAVISLIFIGTAEHPAKIRLRVSSVVGTAIVIGVSLLLLESTALQQVVHRVGRDLSFTTIILNVILWSSLIKTRHRDLRLFLVSGGLGVNMTGEAIAQSLSLLADFGIFVNVLAVGTHIFCLLVWLKAYRMPVPTEQRHTPLTPEVDVDSSATSQFAAGEAES